MQIQCKASLSRPKGFPYLSNFFVNNLSHGGCVDPTLPPTSGAISLYLVWKLTHLPFLSLSISMTPRFILFIILPYELLQPSKTLIVFLSQISAPIFLAPSHIPLFFFFNFKKQTTSIFIFILLLNSTYWKKLFVFFYYLLYANIYKKSIYKHERWIFRIQKSEPQ